MLFRSRLDQGFFDDDGCTFRANVPAPGPTSSWTVSRLRACGGHIHAFLADGFVVLLRGTVRLRHETPPGPSDVKTYWSKRHSALRPSLFLPDYIRLPIDPASGLPVVPTTRITDVVAHREAWRRLVPSLDGAASAVVNGLFVYSRSGDDG